MCGLKPCTGNEYEIGFNDGFEKGFREGEERGFIDGEARGYKEGKEVGIEELEFDSIFDLFDVDIYMVEKILEHAQQNINISPAYKADFKKIVNHYFPGLF